MSFDATGRWGLLLKGCDLAMDFTKVVQVCCVLHNLCEGAGDMFFEHWYGTVRSFNANYPQPKSKLAPVERPGERPASERRSAAAAAAAAASADDDDDEDDEADDEEYEEMLQVRLSRERERGSREQRLQQSGGTSVRCSLIGRIPFKAGRLIGCRAARPQSRSTTVSAPALISRSMFFCFSFFSFFFFFALF